LDSLYFGIGLGNHHTLTNGLPFDVMLMILAAEKINRELGLSNVSVLIADQQSLTSYARGLSYLEERVKKLAATRQQQISGFSNKLGFKNWNVNCGSEISTTPEYQEILEELRKTLPQVRNQYALMELADIEWFSRHKRTDIKLGWTAESIEHDERWFDKQYRSFLGNSMTFVYTEAGRTIEGSAAPPYSHSGDSYNVASSDDRLLVKPNEEIQKKFRRMPKKIQNFYGHLTNLFASLGYPLTGGQTQEIFQNKDLISARLSEMYKAIL